MHPVLQTLEDSLLMFLDTDKEPLPVQTADLLDLFNDDSLGLDKTGGCLCFGRATVLEHPTYMEFLLQGYVAFTLAEAGKLTKMQALHLLSRLYVLYIFRTLWQPSLFFPLGYFESLGTALSNSHDNWLVNKVYDLFMKMLLPSK